MRGFMPSNPTNLVNQQDVSSAVGVSPKPGHAKELASYLNDHLAGATLAVELARRTARANAGTALGVFLTESLVPEITEDRETLERLMDALVVKRSRSKVVAA